MRITNLPSQKVPLKKKTKKWREGCLDALITEGNYEFYEKDTMDTLYRAYYGELEKDMYSYVTNPLNSRNSNYTKFPARLRNYNIIKPIIDLFLGERARRPFKKQVAVHNSDSYSIMMEELKQATNMMLQQMFVNSLNAEGVETGQQSEEVQPPEQIARTMEMTYKDARAIQGQEALDYIVKNHDVFDVTQRLLWHWLVSGYTVSYKGGEHGEIVYEEVSPYDVTFAKSPDNKYLEDSDYVVVRKRMTSSDIIDKFYDLLSEDDINYLENPKDSNQGGLIKNLISESSDEDINSGEAILFDVFHVCWKSKKRIGILSYTDEFGQPQELTVDENYRLDKERGETIEWYWVNEVWEGYRIDDKIYLDIKPSPIQRRSRNNLSDCKLPYNGIIEKYSIAQQGLAYQILYNIFHYRLELSIAKNKDKIMLMEINTIPERHGWDAEKFMYYADAMGFAFVDSTGEGNRNQPVNFNQYTVLDMSLANYIASQFELLQAIKTEWEELVGVPRQRKGQVMASDSVGSTERSVFQASIITEELFRRFEKFIERELQGLLDASKIVWQENKTISYVTSDSRHVIFQMDDGLFRESEFGVYVNNSSKEHDKLEMLKEQALAFAQNGAMPSTIAEILDSDNFTHIKSLLREVEVNSQQMQQQAAQQEAQSQEAERQFEAEQNELDRQNRLQIAQISAQSKMDSDLMKAMNTSEEDDSLEREKMQMQDRHEGARISLEERKRKDAKELGLKKIEVDKKKATQKPKTSK